MKIAVTGGAGFIGSHLVDRLVADGHDVIVIDNLSNGRPENINRQAVFIKHDVQNDMTDIFKTEKPEVVFHLAAQIDAAKSVAEPELDEAVNVGGTQNVIAASHVSGVRKIIFSSTAAVYGDVQIRPTPEDAPLEPISQYGKSKLAAERLLAASGLDYVILRYSNVYGPRQGQKGEGGVVAIFGHKLLSVQPPVINGDGLQTRDFIYVDDVVAANLKALVAPVSLTLNVSTSTAVTINKLAEIMQSASKTAMSIPHGSSRRGDILHSQLDNALAQGELGWQPRVGLEEGIALTIQSFRA